LQFHQKYKNKTDPEIRLKKSAFSIDFDLAPILGRQSTPEIGWRDAAQQVGSRLYCPLHAESFFGSDAPIRVVRFQLLASEARAVFGADPFGLHGLTCPWALSSPAIDPHIYPDTAIDPGKHFLCDADGQTAGFEIDKSMRRTKWR